MISAAGDTIHFLIGGRYDWAETGAGSGTTAVAASSAVTTLADRAFSPRIGLVYQPQPWLSFYGNYSQSLGVNNGMSSTGQPLASQKGAQWEGGAKAEFFDKRLAATMAFYDITKTNIPAPNPQNPTVTNLIGAAESKGVELDITGRVNDNWSVIANFSHDDARVTQGNPFNPKDPTDQVTEAAVTGNKLTGVPDNAGNLWVKYDADGDFKGLSAAAGLSVVGLQQGDNANSYQLPAYTLVNGMIAYRFSFQGAQITAQLNVNNLFNTTYYIFNPFATRLLGVFAGTPRTILGSLRVEF